MEKQTQSLRQQQQCGTCLHVRYDSPKDAMGNKLPYGGGLVGCPKRKSNVGFYPYQVNSCPKHSHADS